VKSILLIGPTASGKSAMAMQLATRYPVEIISLDSALVYRQMDIGTAKPTRAEQALVPHHLIDILEPTQAYSAAQFVRDANDLVEQIRARQRVPLIVGGTMLYAKALLQGIDNLPTSEPSIRKKIDAQALAQGWPAMHTLLANIDPITATRLNPNDAQRIQRALEVFEMTGKPLSSFFTDKPSSAANFFVASLEPIDRAALHATIAQRFDAMLNANFLDEVRVLKARDDLTAQHPAMRCVGYRQAWAHLNNETDIDTFRMQGIIATRQLAKRQMTWLRSLPVDNRLATALPPAAMQVQALFGTMDTLMKELT
jgi:tRNA dimethylallyltransferase